MSGRSQVRSRWRPRAAAMVAASALVVVVPAVAASPADDGPPRTLNALGGNGPGEGLRVTYASGQLEVVLDGEHQLATAGLQPGARLAAGNHFSLAVGGTVISDVLAATGAADALPWETISTFQSYGTIFSTFTPPAALAGFGLFVTVSYTAPGERVSIRARVDVPEGTAEPVRLFWVGQPGLAGADAYTVPELRLVGAFAPRPTEPVTYRAHTVEEGLGQPFQHLVGPAACPYVAVAEGCPAGSGFVAANADLPDAVVDVVDAPLSLAVEYGPLPVGRNDVGFELGFLTLAQPPVAPPPPPPPTEPPPSEPPPPPTTPPPIEPPPPTTTPPPSTATPPTTSPPPTAPPPPTTMPPITVPPTTTTPPPTLPPLSSSTTTSTRPAPTATTTTTTRPTTTWPTTTTTTRPGTTATALPGPPAGTTTTRAR